MRQPAVAGQFYESDPKRLKKQIEECFLHEVGPGSLPKKGESKEEILGAVVPHAGYMYSGPVAAHVYSELAKKEPGSIVIMGPNHTGLGSGVSISKEDWKTPLGVVKANAELAESLWKNCEIIDHDETAHKYEHSIEVQLPFLQYIYEDFEFVPICIGLQDLQTAAEIGRALSELEDVLILASSDFTHCGQRYEQLPPAGMNCGEFATNQDKQAIKNIIELNEEDFVRTVNEKSISVCGYGPIAACVSSVKSKAKEGKLLKYASSGDITGDYAQVVAYAAITFN